MVRETVDIRDLPARLTELLSVVARGDEIMLVQNEQPVARLSPPRAATQRIPGLHRGDIWLSDDFDDPLPDDFWSDEG